MKRLTLIALLVSATWATDFSQLSTQELINMRGSISFADRPAFKAEMQKRMQSLSPQERQQMMKGKGKGMKKQGMNHRADFSTFDTDRNGKITSKEFYDAQAAHMTAQANAGKPMKNAANIPTFEQIDSNKDGIVSQNEFSTFQQNKMQQMVQKRGL